MPLRNLPSSHGMGVGEHRQSQDVQMSFLIHLQSLHNKPFILNIESNVLFRGQKFLRIFPDVR